MSIQISISGLDGVSKDLDQSLAQFVKELSNDVLVDAKSFTPVRSGNARSGWKQSVTKKDFTVENHVPYIERLENNWSKQTHGRGIIGPTLDKVKGKYK